nr:MAG TPA: PROTEIN/RNA Complex, archaeal, ribosomal, 50S, protein.0A [Caudoviricetes sp.]
MNLPIICPYCSSIENNGRTCFWCGNPVTEYESEEKNMTIEMKFTGLSPEQALKLIKAASGAPAEAQTEAAPAAPAVAAPVQPVIPTAQAVPVAVPHVQPIPTAQPIPVAAPTVQPAPTAPQVPAAPPAAQTIPTAVRQYTQDELAVAARPLCENEALRGKLLELLHTFSYTDSAGAVKQVQSIRDLPPESYAAMANGIRQLGGKI